MIDYLKQAIENIEFEDKQTDVEEFYGIYRIPTQKGCVEFVKLYKETVYKPHIHDHADASFIFLTGSGFVTLNEDKIPYKVGDKVEALAGVLHGFLQVEETIFLSIQSNPIQDRSTGEIDIRYE
jgi:quercetin dioxygenase-like cupin family protein